jgi:carboxypeptidase C (cathepsin A)
MMGRPLSLLLAALVAFTPFRAQAFQAPVPPPPLLVPGDEPVVVTEHELRTSNGIVAYEARAGRIPIRNDESGEVRGHIFFVAYVAKSAGSHPRPITFIWNGGPTTNSLLLHTEMFGPRRIVKDRFVDNAQSLLTVSDLVFMDPVGTGFSRPESAESEGEFLSVLGDFAATAEFIRAYRARFDAQGQPLFLAGESYGTWRVSGVAELLAKRGIRLDGAILISGGIPGSGMPAAFSDAMDVPARTAAAFYHKKLAPDLMRDRGTTLKKAAAWAKDVYWPALRAIDKLEPGQREEIARSLARYTGVPATAINRKTLVMTNRQYLRTLIGADPAHVLDTFDMRIAGPEPEDPGYAQAITGYLRGALGYRTDLAYTGIEDGYMPMPGPERRSTGMRWSYNHVTITPEMLKRAQQGGGPPGSLPWLQNAMHMEPQLRVFVAAGRYDSLNMCEGNEAIVEGLDRALSRRFTTRCYEGGHMIYRDELSRIALSNDIEDFVRHAANPKLIANGVPTSPSAALSSTARPAYQDEEATPHEIDPILVQSRGTPASPQRPRSA